MSKRLVRKLAVTTATLGVASVLQGCVEQEDPLVLNSAWLPVANLPVFGFSLGGNQGTGGTSGQNTGLGGVNVSGGGGGNPVGVTVIQ